MENSNWKLVYCFSKKLAVSTERFNSALSCLKNSIETNSKFHELKIYTDKDTYKFLENFTDDIEIIEYNDFSFLDDIKIQTLPLLKENEILIDIDIFLGNSLKINLLTDVVLDRPSYVTESYYRTEIERSLQYEFSKLLNYNPKKNEIGNIGIMKFVNKELEKKYINFYTKIKENILNQNKELPPFPAFSVLIGQIGLKNVIDDNNYTISYASKLDNNYFHLAGSTKYKTVDFEKLNSRLTKTLI
jgi:hypothetical protein